MVMNYDDKYGLENHLNYTTEEEEGGGGGRHPKYTKIFL